MRRLQSRAQIASARSPLCERTQDTRWEQRPQAHLAGPQLAAQPREAGHERKRIALIRIPLDEPGRERAKVRLMPHDGNALSHNLREKRLVGGGAKEIGHRALTVKKCGEGIGRFDRRQWWSVVEPVEADAKTAKRADHAS
ncbi:MAG TPA: hypothetical protein VF316_08890 [Polyangiaceae bacterium]